MQSLLGKTGKEGLKRRILQCDISDVSLEASKRARAVVGDADLETVRDLSAGAATFFVWVRLLVSFKVHCLTSISNQCFGTGP